MEEVEIGRDASKGKFTEEENEREAKAESMLAHTFDRRACWKSFLIFWTPIPVK